MAKLVVMERCHRCKLKIDGVCRGQHAVKGATLERCEGYIDSRSIKESKHAKYIPFPEK